MNSPVYECKAHIILVICIIISCRLPANEVALTYQDKYQTYPYTIFVFMMVQIIKNSSAPKIYLNLESNVFLQWQISRIVVVVLECFRPLVSSKLATIPKYLNIHFQDGHRYWPSWSLFRFWFLSLTSKSPSQEKVIEGWI